MNNSAIKRILFDRKLLLKNPLDSLGIYIIFDDDDVYSAKALIIGPRDTPYHMGYYLFDIKFPDNYPFSPPKVKLETLDPNSKIRLNPNLYTNGKVCLSILNTWSGPKWNPCQNISSVLISIQSILNENPLHNEPGWENETGSINEAYNNIITHENEVSISQSNITKRKRPSLLSVAESAVEEDEFDHNASAGNQINSSTSCHDVSRSTATRRRASVCSRYQRTTLLPRSPPRDLFSE